MPGPDDPTADTAPGKEEFPCESCGAKLHFEPGVQKLRCPYCDHEQAIIPTGDIIHEYDFYAAQNQARTMHARDLSADGDLPGRRRQLDVPLTRRPPGPRWVVLWHGPGSLRVRHPSQKPSNHQPPA